MYGDDVVNSDEAIGEDDTRLSPALQPPVRDPEYRRRRRAIEAALFGTSQEIANIGRFRLLQRLGEGGMGTVYAAYDEHLDRKIAIKLLSAGLAGNVGLRERTLREARALARLSHPNVVHVYESGQLEGELFVAMEFLAGPTLREWIDRGDARDWSEVVPVLRQAGEGLAAAHAEGIVHRDFKPHNVMFGADGRVRVLDFGLARLGEDARTPSATAESVDGPVGASLTVTGAVLGTPAYMAPEQIAGQVADVRSDQFSFCVTLYEALYGRRPFEGQTLAELAESIADGRIDSPASSAVPMWLRKVVLRGLAHDPKQRFESMRALLDAMADDPATRRRRRWSAALIAGLLAGGIWGGTRALGSDGSPCTGMDARLSGVWDVDRRAQVEAAILATGLSYAPDTAAGVEQQLDDYARDWVAARVEACEATHRGEQSGAMLDKRMACLDERLVQVRATVELLAGADSSVVAEAQRAVAGLPALERCADTAALEAQVPPPEDPRSVQRVAELDERLARARALIELGRYDDSLAGLDEIADEVDALDYEPLAVRAWLVRASALRGAGRYAEAESTFERAYEVGVGLRMPTEVATAASELVNVVGYRLSRPADGQRWALHARAWVRAEGTDRLRMTYLNSIGTLAMSLDEHADAYAHFEESMALAVATHGPAHLTVIRTLNNLGLVAKHAEDFERAGDYLERALAMSIQVLGEQHPHVGNALTQLGGLYTRRGQYDEARRYHERGLVIRERALGPEHPDVADALRGLGDVEVRTGNYAKAREHLLRALAIRERSLGSEHRLVAMTLGILGLVERKADDLPKAREYLERSLSILEATVPDVHDVAACLTSLGNLERDAGNLPRARGYHERALAVWTKVHGPDHPALGVALSNLGNLAAAEGRYDEARELLTRAVTVLEKRGPEHPSVALTVNALGIVAAEQEEYAEAETHFRRAQAAFETAMGRDHTNTVKALGDLGRAVLAQGRPAEALPLLEDAVARLASGRHSPERLARVRFTLARALWEAPEDRGRDRPRARRLARRVLTADVELSDSTRANMEAWLRERAR